MTNTRELPPQSATLVDSTRIVIERDGGLVEAFVPIDLINQEDVAFDHEHAAELAASIQRESAQQGTTGQLSPVLLAEVPELDRFVIIDGFHRTPALASLGHQEVYATIKPGCTWEDVVDLRIVAARSHKTVKFARIVEWVGEAWERSPWAEKIGVGSAFQIAFLKSQNGARSGVTPEEAEEIRAWVSDKCEQWGVSGMAIQGYLRTARLADPKLVQSARDRKSGHKLDAITPKHLDQIARYLPEDYASQNIVADAATANALTIPETKALAIAVSRAKDEEQARACVENKVWRRMDAASRKLTRKRYKEIDPNRPEQFVESLVDKFFDEQIEVAKLLIENAVLAGLYDPQVEEQSGRMNMLAVESDVMSDDEEAIGELPEGQEIAWDQANILRVIEKTIALEGAMLHVARQRYGLRLHDGEDAISVARMRFLTKIEEGKFPESLVDDETHLRRLFTKFVGYASIDHHRGEVGRNGQKKRPLSLDAPIGLDDGDVSLLGVVADAKANEGLFIDTENADFIKRALPCLSEKERRVVILKGYFELTAQDIAIVIGTTAGSVNQLFQTAKAKIVRLTD